MTEVFVWQFVDLLADLVDRKVEVQFSDGNEGRFQPPTPAHAARSSLSNS